MTPLGQRPLELGADLVVHSATKLLAGHSDVLLGAVVAGEGTGRCDSLRQRRSLAGAVPGTMETYLALRGVRTLPLRLERASANAHELARRLADAPRDRTRPVPRPTHRPWPRTGPSPDGQLRHRCSLSRSSAVPAQQRRSPAQPASSCTRPASAASRPPSNAAPNGRGKLAPPALLRLSVGCEDVEDLWSDLEHALGIAAAVRSRATPPMSALGLDRPSGK